ncbi:retrotransposon protein [Cucumis melo var. makuwa]|uniref:Retrotransposon protein n=1 Tax=Cucumis melo var. makuwa TaxID=1194695 RepID=A0A5A7TA55_CUCMM|nr:retrotransposon protein [Cucumis melo var. makuwa]
MGLKEMILDLTRSVEKLGDEVKESSVSVTKRREESCASDRFGLKLKGKVEEIDATSGLTGDPPDRSKYKKLEMLVFIDGNPESKVYRAEHYLEINELADTEKDLARQNIYKNYVKIFLNNSIPLPEMAESVLIDAFVTSLEPTLQAEGNKIRKKWERQTDYPMRQISIPIKGNYTRGEPPVRRLSDSEFRARLDKGLCFRCNNKYSHGYRCKIKDNRELMLLIMNEEDKDEADVKEETELLDQKCAIGSLAQE